MRAWLACRRISVGYPPGNPYSAFFKFPFADQFHDPGFSHIGNGERLHRRWRRRNGQPRSVITLMASRAVFDRSRQSQSAIRNREWLGLCGKRFEASPGGFADEPLVFIHKLRRRIGMCQLLGSYQQTAVFVMVYFAHFAGQVMYSRVIGNGAIAGMRIGIVRDHNRTVTAGTFWWWSDWYTRKQLLYIGQRQSQQEPQAENG